MSRDAIRLLHVVTAGPQDGTSLLPGSDTKEAVDVPAKPCSHLPAPLPNPLSLPGAAVLGQAQGRLGLCVGLGAGASPGKGPAVTGDAAGCHLLTPAGPCCPALPGHCCLYHHPEAGVVSPGRLEQPAQLPHTWRDARHGCWWQQTPSLHT